MTVGIVIAMFFGITSLILVGKLAELDAKRAKEEEGGASLTGKESGSEKKGGSGGDG
jgi:hypothetical protein